MTKKDYEHLGGGAPGGNNQFDIQGSAAANPPILEIEHGFPQQCLKNALTTRTSLGQLV